MNDATKTKTEAAPADVIGQFRQYQAVLSDSAVAIPKLLKQQRQLREELGRSEITGNDVQKTKERLDTIIGALASAARQRAAASDGLLALADELRQSRAAVSQELAQITQAVTNDFAMRWAQACAELGQLVAEAGALSSPTSVHHL
jgi:hypothetical protein